MRSDIGPRMRALAEDWIRVVEQARQAGYSEPEHHADARRLRVAAYKILLGEGIDPADAVRVFQRAVEAAQKVVA